MKTSLQSADTRKRNKYFTWLPVNVFQKHWLNEEISYKVELVILLTVFWAVSHSMNKMSGDSMGNFESTLIQKHTTHLVRSN